jgi:hypothetical protein
VEEAGLFGDALHVTFADAGRAGELVARVEAAGLGPVALQPIDPSLEDVFLHVLAGAETHP